MKRKLRNVLIGLLVILFVLRLTGILVSFSVSSTSNEPNLKFDSHFIGTNLIKPKALEFGYFKFSDSTDGFTIVKRLIALPGDQLECRNGEYIVNQKNVDKDLDLRFGYKVDKNFYNKYILGRGDRQLDSYPISGDSFLVHLNKSFVAELPIKLKRVGNTGIRFIHLSKDIFNKSSKWNQNNFGPIRVPKGKYFFSGDSRDNSIDSRFRGFVDEENIKGTLLFKY